MHDIKRVASWKRVAIKDRTKNIQGVPTFLAMERLLSKMMR
jgi:hypothetical protein